MKPAAKGQDNEGNRRTNRRANSLCEGRGGGGGEEQET